MTSLRILIFSLLLLQTSAQAVDSSVVSPNNRAPPIPTSYSFTQELSSWQSIQIFTTLLQTFPFLMPQNESLILAPTNAAFLKLLSRLAPQEENPLSMAASIVNTLDKLISTGNLTRILAYHIIPQNVMETELSGNFLTLSGGALSFRDFPSITDIDPVTQPRRLYRQIKALGGSLMFISDVLLPLPLQVIVPGARAGPGSSFRMSTRNDVPFSHRQVNESAPGLFNSSVPSPPVPPPGGNQDLSAMILNALSPALSQDFFMSNALLIASRSDLRIMNALIETIPELKKTVTSTPLHIIAPTDTAFLRFIYNISKTMDLPDLSLPPVSDPGFLSNLTDILKVTSSVEKIWTSIAGLPGLGQIVAYHIVPGAFDYSTLMERSRSQPIATSLTNYSLVFQSDAIVDADPSRGNPKPIASFPTLTGHVTLSDGVLMPFNSEVAGAILDGANLFATPTPTAEEPVDEAACFPADGVVHTKHGVTKMGDLMGGDEIRVDENEERHSAVFMFTHKCVGGTYDFVKISTASGHNVTLTSGHYLHSKQSLVAAGNIRIGDMLRTISGESAVTKVEQVRGRGLIAPHTVDGGLIVDGVLVSGYSRTVHPWIAHALLAPVRWYVKMTGAVEPMGGTFYGGGRGFESLLPSGAIAYEWV